MTLRPGSRLGPYEILAPLGAGGMGEVYKARDPRLERQVAIKILPAQLAGDADRLRRFEQEARAASALNHPHILAIFDFGTHGETPYLVSELLEGETLRELLSQGALPVRKSCDLAAQLAAGLAAAHDKGIVHRDLKPENIFVSRGGRVKILDFGLARVATMSDSATAFAAKPTMTGGTEPGVVLGTAGYMAPEQVRGLPADARSDIFALGAILYEMLTGRRAFHGDSAVETMSAILKEDPPELRVSGRAVPPSLERLVRHCLEKNPAERWQTAYDVALQLEGSSEASAPAAAIAPPRGRRVASGLLAAAAALVLTVFGWWLGRREHPPEPTPVAAAVSPPAGTDFSAAAGMFALSGDGRRLVFRAGPPGSAARLWVRDVASLAARELPGTEEAAYPFWSADGRAIGFFADRKLKRVSAEGGPTQTLCDAPAARGGSWSRDGVILFAPGFGEAIFRIAASGGTPEQVTRRDAGRHEHSHRWPVFLPDGERFLYLVHTEGPAARARNTIVRAGDLRGGESKPLVEVASNPSYSAGHLLFLREGNLVAQPFDAERLETAGEAFPVAEKLLYSLPFDLGDYSVSATGTLVYRASSWLPSRLVWYDRSGSEVGTMAEADHFRQAHLSPDGTHLAVVRPDPVVEEGDIWIYPTARGAGTRITFDPLFYTGVFWAPDGTRLVYGDGRRIALRSLDASAPEEVVFESEAFVSPQDISADGRFLLFARIDPETDWDLWALPLDGTRRPFEVVHTPFRELAAHFGPDGRSVAYNSNESGVVEVYVRPFPGPGAPVRVSNGGGNGPLWRRDGRELYYRSREGIVAVAVGEDLAVGTPTPLFAVEVSSVPVMASEFQVTPDGQLFLVNVPVGKPPKVPITLLTDWRRSTADGD